jgi:hypothetical protein
MVIKICKLIQWEELLSCFSLKGNILIGIHNESEGKHFCSLKKLYSVQGSQNVSKIALSARM